MTVEQIFFAIQAFSFIEKMTCFLSGLVVIFLGYKLIRAGVSGEFKFNAEFKGVKGGLIGSSPGLFFVFLGVLLIGYAEGIKPDNAKFEQEVIHKDGEKERDSIKFQKNGTNSPSPSVSLNSSVFASSEDSAKKSKQKKVARTKKSVNNEFEEHFKIQK